MKKIINYIERDKSVITKKENLELLYTFKNFPVFFGPIEQNKKDDIVADMSWSIDPDTGIIQLAQLIPLDILYMHQHVDAYGKTWAEYNNAFSDYVNFNKIGDILEIGGGSGKLANIILSKNKNIKYTIIEPNPLCEETEQLKIIKGFFNKNLTTTNNTNTTVIFSQVYEHVYDPEIFLQDIYDFLPIGGKLIFAYPNLEYWFKNKFTNAINFEHTLLMTDYYVDYFLQKIGFNIIEKYEYKNHSHFYTVEKSINLNTNINLENKYTHYKQLFTDFITHYQNYINNVNQFISDKQPVFLFGAHIFSHYLMGFGLDTSNIKCVLDNSPLKINKRLYGTSFDIKSPKILSDYKNPIVILNAALYNDEIKNDIITNINSSTIFI